MSIAPRLSVECGAHAADARYVCALCREGHTYDAILQSTEKIVLPAWCGTFSWVYRHILLTAVGRKYLQQGPPTNSRIRIRLPYMLRQNKISGAVSAFSTRTLGASPVAQKRLSWPVFPRSILSRAAKTRLLLSCPYWRSTWSWT